jgi:predicted nucleotidyltransferase
MDEKPALESIMVSLREILPELREHYRVRDIGLFGSYVHSGERPEDLDILVTYEEAPSLLRFLELENLLSDRLGVTVDLVMRDALKPRIGSRILRDLVPV